MNEPHCSRRDVLQSSVAGAGLLLAGGHIAHADPARGKGTSTIMKPQNSDFYDTSGAFQADKARQAYFDMMTRFGYPIPPKLREEMWAVDFKLDDFVNVGMGGIFWWNNKEYGFFGHEIFLLPGQMIVEHAHVALDDIPPKVESWLVRHGMVYTFGEGEETRPMPIELPRSQEKFITARCCQRLLPGEVAGLNRPEAKHFMIAGPEGAIVTEFATFHDNKCLRFTNPGVKF